MGTEILLTVVLGVVIVFIGLICILLLSKIMSAICNVGKSATESKITPAAPVAVQAAQPIENREEIIAAVSAAIAEDMGTDISAIRILSFKKI